MLLKDLLLEVSWSDIESSLLSFYPEEKDELLNYKKLVFSLYERTPVFNEDEMTITVEYVKDFELEETEKENWYWKVSGIMKGDDQTYALDFSSFDEWLGFYVNYIPEKLSKSDFIAHCLWEMSFISFSDEDIEKEKEALKKEISKLEGKYD